MDDQPTAESLGRTLGTRWLGRALQWHPSCGSTNDLAMERARAGAPAGLVVGADTQTAGRGRLGRAWHSPAGENLYFSVVLRPDRPPAEIPPLTLLVGAAVAVALRRLGLSPRLKWPNDVQL
ncbi:MAG TPA: biotin--[acetyl-CoA-carboxylase] ligase, partial [Polyangia bacterium]|nr:biotin--[acetyl-CoA-carboxylase] ligase [Polyangia bacterium]